MLYNIRELEFFMVERIKHEYFQEPEESLSENTWFGKFGRTALSTIFIQKDVRFSRALVSNMLTEAWNESEFFEENGHMIPSPDEVDRMHLICHLQHIASSTGLLNGEEIRKIQESEGRVLIQDFLPKEGPLINFESLKEMTTLWRSQGLKIGLFHGAFDPPTVVHLACATEAYTLCDRLIIGFDGDDLLRSRKRDDRPRYPLDWRRKVFGSFWMVDGTFVLRADRIEDVSQYVQDYRDLHIDYVFLARQQEDKNARVKKIRASGAKPKILVHTGFELPATSILRLIKERGW